MNLIRKPIGTFVATASSSVEGVVYACGGKDYVLEIGDERHHIRHVTYKKKVARQPRWWEVWRSPTETTETRSGWINNSVYKVEYGVTWRDLEFDAALLLPSTADAYYISNSGTKVAVPYEKLYDIVERIMRDVAKDRAGTAPKIEVEKK